MLMTGFDDRHYVYPGHHWCLAKSKKNQAARVDALNAPEMQLSHFLW